MRTYALRGDAQRVLACRDKEVLIAGPAGTGKTYACLAKVHLMALKNPGSKYLLLRKTLVSLTATGLATFRDHVAQEAIDAGLVKWYGGSSERPAGYQYINGSFVAVGGMDNPTKIMSSEYDCLVGETLVSSPSDIQRAYGRPYSGKLVTITTASGNQLTGTPNHPIFTDHGWVALGALREGDHVISRVRAQREVVGGACPDVADQPAPIAEIARALVLTSAGRTERVETVPMDFHGDGGHGYVDVVTAGGLLQDGDSSSCLEHLLELERERRDLEQRALMGVGPLVQAGFGGAPAPVAGTLRATQRGHACTVGLGAAPGLGRALACGGEFGLPDGIGAHSLLPLSERLGRRFPGQAAREHLALEPTRTDADRFSGFGKPEFPFEVAPDRVIEVVIADAGTGRHVYNLQTADSWYVANGIVSHNCIYVQEATELSPDDWEKCTTRLRNGKVSFQQLLADCNPEGPEHWLKKRCDEGKTTMLYGRHTDNPRLFDGQGEPTVAGQSYLATLAALSGVRRLRLEGGVWAAAEGLVYEEWNPALHILDKKKFKQEWPRYWAIDFGYTNPFVWQQWVIDDDGRAILEKEIYRSKRIVADHAQQILSVVTANNDRVFKADGTIDPQKSRWIYPRPVKIICDHDAEDRATLERSLDMGTVPAQKTVSDGIQAMMQRMAPRADGTPGMYVARTCLVDRDEELAGRGLPLGFLGEVTGYIWETAADGKLNKDRPLKLNDHSCDAARYLFADLDNVGTFRVRFM